MDKSKACARSTTININNDDKTSAKGDCEIPADLDMNLIYCPQYSVTELISTKRDAKPRPLNSNPPRPPNSFFLMKNCYMLELRKLGYRFTMPKICRQSKYIWGRLPQEVKERYDELSYKAQIIHQNLYPNYKFSPKPKNPFKNTFPPIGSNKKSSNGLTSTFSVNFHHEPPILSPPLTPPPPSSSNYFTYAIEDNCYNNAIIGQSSLQSYPPSPPLQSPPLFMNENFVYIESEPLDVNIIPSNDNNRHHDDNNCHHNEIYYQYYGNYNNNNNNNNGEMEHYFYERYVEGIQNNILH